VNPIWDRPIHLTSLTSTLRLSSSLHSYLHSGHFLSDSSVKVVHASLMWPGVLLVLVCDAVHSERREEGRGTVISGTWAMRKSIPLLSSPGVPTSVITANRASLLSEPVVWILREAAALYITFTALTHTHKQQSILLHLCKHPRLGRSRFITVSHSVHTRNLYEHIPGWSQSGWRVSDSLSWTERSVGMQCCEMF
jgi:hypothetical protein